MIRKVSARLFLFIVLILTVVRAVWAEPYSEFEAGNTAAQRADFDLAIHHYSRAIQSGEFPDDKLAFTFSNRGNAYYLNGDYDQAIQDYDQAIRLSPDFALAFYNRGNAYLRKGNDELAIKDYDTAITLKPEYAKAFGNRGVAYERLGKHDQAVWDYRRQYELGIRPKWLVEKLRSMGKSL